MAVAAPAETCGRLAAALGIDAGDVGYALRTVLLVTDVQERVTRTVNGTGHTKER